MPEYEFLVSPIRHIHSEGTPYTAQLAASERGFSFFSVQGLRFSLLELVDLGMEIIVFRDSVGYRFKDLSEKTFGNKKVFTLPPIQTVKVHALHQETGLRIRTCHVCRKRNFLFVWGRHLSTICPRFAIIGLLNTNRMGGRRSGQTYHKRN